MQHSVSLWFMTGLVVFILFYFEQEKKRKEGKEWNQKEKEEEKSQDKRRSCPALKIQSPRVNHFLSFPENKTKQNKNQCESS